MTSKGPAVLLPSLSNGNNTPRARTRQSTESISPFSDSDDEEDSDLDKGRRRSEEVRSPIAQLLYHRWVMNLRDQCKSLFIYFPLVVFLFMLLIWFYSGNLVYTALRTSSSTI